MSEAAMMRQIHSDILAAMGDDWETAAELHHRLGMWAKTTVRTKLNELTSCGVVERRTQPHPTNGMMQQPKAVTP